MTVAELLGGSPLPRAEARRLLQEILGLGRAYLAAHPEQSLSPGETARFRALEARRQQGEPLAYLVGFREFYGLEFRVSDAVLIPRPETELLVDLALERTEAEADLLDLGTGSGAVAVAVAHARPRARIVAVDCSPAALAVARENAGRLLPARAPVEFVESDWFAALGARRFDIVVANPPYVAADDPHLSQGDLRFEPQPALVGGSDGLDAIRAIVAAAPGFLRGGGWFLLEHGYDQAAACRELLSVRGFGEVASMRDLAGIERVSGGRWNRESFT